MIIYDFFRDDTIIAGFSERSGGVSPIPDKSLNLSFSREPYGNRENVLENYRIAAGQLGVDPESITRMSQVHGRDILRVEAEHRGMGVMREIAPELARHGFDGMITNGPGITLSTTHADCTPVLLYDPDNRAIGAVHSGWKGTCLKIADEAVKRMTAEFGTRPEDLKAIIGPAISMAHFEVRRDVYDQFTEAFSGIDERTLNELIRKDAPVAGSVSGADNDQKWHINMRGFVKLTLLGARLRPDNILDDDSCTFAQSSRFFSHRRDGGKAGAMAAFIFIKEHEK